MKLHIQDPADPQAPFLHEKILELCQGAARGGGAFSFASSDGVNLLMKDDVFRAFLKGGSFELVVGVDAITNEKALATLKQAAAELPKLDVKVFYHQRPQTLFHPKFCWFRHGSKNVLLTGSGNLTVRGLRGNWEAFGIGEVGGTGADSLETQWAGWRKAHESRLRSVDDPVVVARAAKNIRLPSSPITPGEESEVEPDLQPEQKTQTTPTTTITPTPPVAPATSPAATLAVLLAEIPASGDRWKQANFDLETFQKFFGAEPGLFRRVVFQHVNAAGELEALENRPSVDVKSQNYRFELDAAAGKPYPTTGRPIGVFIRLAPRTFRYRLLMPSDPDYTIVNAALKSMWKGRADRMRRVTTTTDFLAKIWPNSPLWVKPLEIED